MANKSKMGSFYEEDFQPSLERAILAEDVTFSSIENVQGKFYIPVMTPTADTSSPRMNSNGRIKTSNYVFLNIPGYILIQFMIGTVSTLTIEKTNMNVKAENGNPQALTFGKVPFTIPKGTVFIAGFLGGEFTIEKTCIVGLLTVDLEN